MQLKFASIVLHHNDVLSPGFSQAKEPAESAESASSDETAEREFTLKVQPLLKDKCLGCHGGDPDDIKGEFSVLTREALLRGGESEEAAIVPGKPDEGTLVAAIHGNHSRCRPKKTID